MVHYLCRGDFGGTGFFRHEATGFESVDTRQGAYVAAAEAELARGVGMSSRRRRHGRLRLIGQADCVFNRLIVYRGHVLHSALLGPERRRADPARAG
jgi:hypothetical protein